MSDHELEFVVARLRQEVTEPSLAEAGSAPPASLPGRAEAERVWAVQPGDPLGGKTGSLRGLRRTASAGAKRSMRKLIRWYLQPALADQRRFNEATLTMIDELARRVAELEARAARAGEPPE